MLGALFVYVVHRAGREAHPPAVGQRTREGQSGSATRMVAHHGDVGTLLHILHKLVGSTEHLAVGEQHHPFLPSDALRGLQPLFLHVGEVVMALASLVLQVSYGNLGVGEAGRQFLCRGNQSAAVVADIENQSVAGQEVRHDIVQIARAHGSREAAEVDVADVVVQDAVSHACGYLIVGAQVASLQCVAEVGGIVLVPAPVAAVVERGVEVHVSVA